ncbi:hypothetical protein VTK73DRAFT_7884 [Phialemonium thermophilum]|uniref:Zn(2)-C6 fungal-type domain-containing protein n=1 Tax=Phialemonium thermophilum TaxID=223376 RepID=A0ABR3XRB7_9PEZI
MSVSQSAAALALRDSFGDRKIPDISRKITACVACRKQKLKCQMQDSKPPCTRCRARGLPCAVNKSLQMLLEGDAHWKERMEQRMRSLEETITLLKGSDAQTDHHSPPAEVRKHTSPPSVASPQEDEQRRKQQARTTTAAAPELTINLSCSLGSYPGSSVATILAAEERDAGAPKFDIISSGLISLQEAEEYFAVYQTSMDPFLHRVLSEEDCLANVRARSSFLTTAICTVGALYTASDSYSASYEAFVQQVSGKVLCRNPSFDDVRALCIGAFWLHEISSSLVASAVRMSRDLYLHRCITKMPHVKRECYDRTRLFLLVYLVDHYCSMVYGKPPMTGGFASLKSPRAFMKSALCSRHDPMLVAHIELWFISSRVFDTFGADVDTHVVADRVAEVETLSRAYRAWHEHAVGSLQGMTMGSAADRQDNDDGDDDPSPFLPRQMLDLHLSFALLFLFSHAFRGLSFPSGHRGISPSENVAYFQRCSFDCALSIVQSIGAEAALRQRLPMLPPYHIAMVAFACICLIRYVRQGHLALLVDEQLRHQARLALVTLADVFRSTAEGMDKKHPLVSLASSLGIVMRRLNLGTRVEAGSAPEPAGRNPESGMGDDLCGHWFELNDSYDANGETIWPGLPEINEETFMMNMDALFFSQSR